MATSVDVKAGSMQLAKDLWTGFSAGKSGAALMALVIFAALQMAMPYFGPALVAAFPLAKVLLSVPVMSIVATVIGKLLWVLFGAAVLHRLLKILNSNKELMDTLTSLSAQVPQLQIVIDQAKAQAEADKKAEACLKTIPETASTTQACKAKVSAGSPKFTPGMSGDGQGS